MINRYFVILFTGLQKKISLTGKIPLLINPVFNAWSGGNLVGVDISLFWILLFCYSQTPCKCMMLSAKK